MKCSLKFGEKDFKWPFFGLFKNVVFNRFEFLKGLQAATKLCRWFAQCNQLATRVCYFFYRICICGEKISIKHFVAPD